VERIMPKIVRKYIWFPTLADIEQVMITFERRCDIQAVPEYVESSVTMTRPKVRYMKANNTYITIQNDKDDMLFKLLYPDCILVEELITG
jgi:hypothetical protein